MGFFDFFAKSGSGTERSGDPSRKLDVLREGHAMRVVFFYPGEEGTFVDHVYVTIYVNGIVQIRSEHEETSTHLQNCEILWRFDGGADAGIGDQSNKVRLLKPKAGEKNPEHPKT